MCIDNCCFGVLSSWNMHKLLFQVRKINKTINVFRNKTSKINAVENTRDASFCADRLFFSLFGLVSFTDTCNVCDIFCPSYQHKGWWGTPGRWWVLSVWSSRGVLCFPLSPQSAWSPTKLNTNDNTTIIN